MANSLGSGVKLGVLRVALGSWLGPEKKLKKPQAASFKQQAA